MSVSYLPSVPVSGAREGLAEFHSVIIGDNELSLLKGSILWQDRRIIHSSEFAGSLTNKTRVMVRCARFIFPEFVSSLLHLYSESTTVLLTVAYEH